MSTAEKIVAAEAKAIELKDALTAESKSYEEGNEESAVVIDELIEGIDVAEAEVKRLRGIEERLKTKAVAVESTPVQAPGVHTIKRIEPVDRLVMNAAAKFESVITGRPLDQVIDRYAGSDDTVKAVASIVNKGAAAPAMTNVEGWAAELKDGARDALGRGGGGPFEVVGASALQAVGAALHDPRAVALGA